MTMDARARGFTLVELLVVISIIGFLSSVVIASLNTARAKGRDARRLQDIKQIQLALEGYYAQNYTYPECLYTGLTNDNSHTCTSSLEAAAILTGIPRDPLSNQKYAYARVARKVGAANCQLPIVYHLGASLENHANPALLADGDLPSADQANGGRCTGSVFAGYNYDFFGLSNYTNGATCALNDSAAFTLASETCYDVAP